MINNHVIEMKKMMTFSQRAFQALDSENKGYLTQEQILAPIMYQGVHKHLGLKQLIHSVESREANYKFDEPAFSNITNHYEFFKKVLQANLIIHDFNKFKKNFEGMY
mmetsp:Transcript_21665/g.20787  ORF Transcript_21665/g.20787 Transcript_21665/m.20787 type:complete len:107 (+) Transcript_21665:248-568(+)